MKLILQKSLNSLSSFDNQPSTPKEPKEDHLPKSSSQPSSPQKFSFNFQNQPQLNSALPSITLFTSPHNPLQLTTINPTLKPANSNHKRSPSLLDFQNHSSNQNHNCRSNKVIQSFHPSSRSPSPASNPNTPRLHSTSQDHPQSDLDSPIDIGSNLSIHSDSDSDSINSNSEKSSDDQNSQDSNQSQHDQIIANTHANSSSITPIDFLQKSHQPIPFLDQAPNITSPPPLPISFSTFNSSNHSDSENKCLNRKSSLHRRKSSLGSHPNLPLLVSRPIYEKNRCTITIEHGNQNQAAQQAERTRFYLVACDLSDESKYAIEWAIGTVLRQGDECFIIMIIETDSKFDLNSGEGSAAEKTAKIRNQKDHQEKATLLVKEAPALLERTGLNVKVACQVIHARNTKHMLVDCIDFLEPNLVVVGSRGLTSLKWNLMGSVSHYLVQKSSVPVMVARRTLRTIPKVYKKKKTVPNCPPKKLHEAILDNNLKLDNSCLKSVGEINEQTDGIPEND
ncbi:hypothetical protein O181_074665 [Austropuccinia psidii MF-1]|uniref:UspA domain-containing protein n=1 Tax=Austropuccinia psidii MF-1 TaxID=1389203 RepID=A0A9Q3FCV7_9BASI|nr:hypothetical protein [Austropuccinia psidii MF-1]